MSSNSNEDVTMAAITHPPVIPLMHHDDARVLIETENDRFMMTVQAAIRACQAYSHMDEFTAQFRKLHTKLSQWIKAHDSGISKAFLTARDAAILLLIVQKSEAFDQDLEDALTDLDLEVAQDEEFNLLRMNALAIPAASDESIESFLVTGSSNL
jgi:hypothetical protein